MNMDKVSNIIAKDSNIPQETEGCLMLQIKELLEKEEQWRIEKDVLLQRERKFAELWEKRESFWQRTFQARDVLWSQVEFEDQKHWMNLKFCYEQRQKQLETTAQESQARQELLLKVLNGKEQNLIIEIEKSIISDTDNMAEMEQFWQWAYHVQENLYSQVHLENQRRWDELKSVTDKEEGDFVCASQEIESQEELLLKVLKEQKRPLVVEIGNIIPDTTDRLPSGEDWSQQIQDLREKESEWREEREVLLLKERCLAEQWQERESFLQSAFYAREQQRSHARFQIQKHWMNWKLLCDQQLLELESTIQMSEAAEDRLMKVLREEKQHTITETQKESVSNMETPLTEPFWRSAFQLRQQHWSQVQLETRRRWAEWNCHYDQQKKDCESAIQMSEERVERLVKILKGHKLHRVIDTSEDTQASEERRSQSTPSATSQLGKPALNAKLHDNSDQVSVFGNFTKEERQFLNVPSGTALKVVPVIFAKSVLEPVKHKSKLISSTAKDKKHQVRPENKTSLTLQSPLSEQHTATNNNMDFDSKMIPEIEQKVKMADTVIQDSTNPEPEQEDIGRPSTPTYASVVLLGTKSTVDITRTAEVPLDNMVQQSKPQQPNVPNLRSSSTELQSAKSNNTLKK